PQAPGGPPGAPGGGVQPGQVRPGPREPRPRPDAAGARGYGGGDRQSEGGGSRAAETSEKPAQDRPKRQPRALPQHLPQIERVIEPASIRCPCGCGDMVRIGEDRSQRLDIVPAQYRVLVTIRPRYACRSEEHTSELQSRENLVC